MAVHATTPAAALDEARSKWRRAERAAFAARSFDPASGRATSTRRGLEGATTKAFLAYHRMAASQGLSEDRFLAHTRLADDVEPDALRDDCLLRSILAPVA
jgi:hypothetical protein